MRAQRKAKGGEGKPATPSNKRGRHPCSNCHTEHQSQNDDCRKCHGKSDAVRAQRKAKGGEGKPATPKKRRANKRGRHPWNRKIGR